MYRIEKIDEDKFKVIGAKEFTLTREVQLARELQSLDVEKTIRLAEVLADRGETIENTKLRITRQEGNKTIVDESNLEAIKKALEKPIMLEIIDKVLKRQIGRTMEEFIADLEITEDEAERFGQEFIITLTNGFKEDTPRKQN